MPSRVRYPRQRTQIVRSYELTEDFVLGLCRPSPQAGRPVRWRTRSVMNDTDHMYCFSCAEWSFMFQAQKARTHPHNVERSCERERTDTGRVYGQKEPATPAESSTGAKLCLAVYADVERLPPIRCMRSPTSACLHREEQVEQWTVCESRSIRLDRRRVFGRRCALGAPQAGVCMNFPDVVQTRWHIILPNATLVGGCSPRCCFCSLCLPSPSMGQRLGCGLLSVHT